MMTNIQITDFVKYRKKGVQNVSSRSIVFATSADWHFISQVSVHSHLVQVTFIPDDITPDDTWVKFTEQNQLHILISK